ncbi:MAG: hypothetical protein EORIYHIE_000326 [Candidatus Fervidibacter sp.]|jgi:hypothetical protein
MLNGLELNAKVNRVLLDFTGLGLEQIQSEREPNEQN